MRIRFILAAAAMAAFPTTVTAQEAVVWVDAPPLASGAQTAVEAEATALPTDGAEQKTTFLGWTVKRGISLKPSFKIDYESVRALDLADVEDEAEYGFAVTLERDFSNFATVSITPAVSLSPRIFDDRDEVSAWSVTGKISNSFDMFTFRETVPSEYRDAWIPFVEYKYGYDYADILSGSSTYNHSYLAGLTLVDIFKLLCKSDVNPRDNICSEGFRGSGLAYELTISYNYLDSEMDSKDRHGFNISGQVVTPFLATSSLWIKGDYQEREYDSLRNDAATGPANTSYYSAEIGIDVSPWVRDTYELSDRINFRLGVRWTRVFGNRTDLERNELSIVPTFSRKW